MSQNVPPELFLVVTLSAVYWLVKIIAIIVVIAFVIKALRR